MWEERAESPELRIRIYTARRKWKILQAQGDPPYCRWAPCRSTPPTARPSQSPERKKNESCIICRDASAYTFSSCTSRRREKENVSINLAGVSIFLFWPVPKKETILAGLMWSRHHIHRNVLWQRPDSRSFHFFLSVEMNRSLMLGISSIPSWKGVNQIVLACLCKKKRINEEVPIKSLASPPTNKRWCYSNIW